MKIGHKIKTLRKEKGLSQEELAKYLRISFQAVSKWENNISLPDITLLPKLADFLVSQSIPYLTTPQNIIMT